MLTLTDRIKQARELTGISRADLARRVGVAPSAAAQWEYENGTAPSVSNLIKIATITDVAFEWLSTGRGPPRPLTLHETPAVAMGDFAHTLFEEHMLQIARGTPVKLREPMLHFLEAMLASRAS